MLESYQQIIPKDPAHMMTLELEQKTGRIPKGVYTFVETYCTDKGCDCRRVCLVVFNGRNKQVATIAFGFDPGEPLAGPFLDEFAEKSSYAEDILLAFVDGINCNPGWLTEMHQRYRKVREKIDGGKYKGGPFPKPGKTRRVAQTPPDMLESILSEMEEEFESAPSSLSIKSHAKRLIDKLGNMLASNSKTENKEDLLTLIDRLVKAQYKGADEMHELDFIIRERIRNDSLGYDELAGLLPRLVPRNEREEDRFFAALGILRMLLEEIRSDIERQRPDAGERMARLQDALARHIYYNGCDFTLCTHVTRTLIDSRADVLPVIRDANREMFFGMGEQSATGEIPVIAPSLGKLLRNAGCPSPFEAMETLLEMIILLDPEIQIQLSSDLLDSRDSFVRDTAALMIFHPCEEVREGIADRIGTGAVRSVSPETLRRLIISRNWFPAGMRKRIDEAISNARRARVDCARLASPPDCSILASTIDGVGAQSIFIHTGSGKKRTLGNILWKQGQGVVDSFSRQGDRKELVSILETFEEQMQLADVAPWFLERLVCHALAVGNDRGKPPHMGLLQVAEMMGCDRWKAELLDPVKELAALREELQRTNPSLLSRQEVEDALEFSTGWPECEEFAGTWFEDDAAVDEIVLNGLKEKRRTSEKKLVGMLLDKALEPRRSIWLERLTLMTLWLRAASNPAIPWHEMFHVAEKLASGAPLKTIPLMVEIAEASLDAATERAVEDIW